MSDVPSDDPGQLPIELLLQLALREVRDDSDGPVPFLVALHQRPAGETFEFAAALVHDSEATRRLLGVRILRELGEEQSDGRRPFSAETIPLLQVRLHTETDPAVLCWTVSALGYHRARETLSDVLALASHPDARVRFRVAAGLPSLVDPTGVEPDAADVLIGLCQDDDADVRYYALYAATREVVGIGVEAMANLLVKLVNDPDEQVRIMAVEHGNAIVEIRWLLNEWDFIGVFDRGSNTDEYDCMIGPLLVMLATDVDVIAVNRWLNDEIRDHFGMSTTHVATMAMAERLVDWWRESHAVTDDLAPY